MNKYVQAIPLLGFLTVILNTLGRLINRSVPQPVVRIPVELPYRGFNPLLPHLDTEMHQPALIAALGYNKAAILQKIWEWQEHNRREKQTFHNGHYWTYDTYDTWQQRHFSWLSVDHLRKLMREMERDGLIVSGQFTKGSAMKWYRVDVKAVAKTTQAAEKVSARAEKITAPSGEKSRIKTKEESTKSNRKSQTTKALTTTAPDEREIPTELDEDTDAVVAVPLPHPTIQAESGEYSIKAEAAPNDREDPHGEPHTVKAGHKDDSNDTSLSKIPLKVLSPSTADVLRADLIRFGVLPNVASRLVDQHGEADTRFVLRYAQESGTLGAGFVVIELDQRRFGVVAAAADRGLMNKLVHDSPTAIDDERRAAMLRETERLESMAAEEAALAVEQSIPEFA